MIERYNFFFFEFDESALRYFAWCGLVSPLKLTLWIPFFENLVFPISVSELDSSCLRVRLECCICFFIL